MFIYISFKLYACVLFRIQYLFKMFVSCISTFIIMHIFFMYKHEQNTHIGSYIQKPNVIFRKTNILDHPNYMITQL